jgi:Putative Ig domain/Right handed beta helix region/IPT/TIG domain
LTSRAIERARAGVAFFRVFVSGEVVMHSVAVRNGSLVFALLISVAGITASSIPSTATAATEWRSYFDRTYYRKRQQPPKISGTPSATATVGKAYSFKPTASDPNGDALGFSISNKPSWASFSTASGLLSGTPTASNVGTTSNIVISVSDGRSKTALPAFSIKVSTATSTTNTAPKIGGSPATSVKAGSAYSFTPAASDANGDKLTFAIANKPGWASFNTTTGQLSGTPSSSNVGTTSGIVISVSDGKVSTSLAAFSIAVTSSSTTPPPSTSNGSPVVLYTDLVAGPTTGGENDLGAYISIFGRNFGSNASNVRVYFGNTEAAAYRYFGVSKGRSDVQQITVQAGNIGSGAKNIKVVVNGVSSNSNLSFLPNAGDILFVDNVSGNDSTAAKNDINRPWRTVQTASEGGALSQAKPGDVIVLRGKAIWKDVGFEKRWFRFRRTAGTQPTGAKGTGYITIEAYPKEDVHYVPPASTSGGIHGMGDSYPQYADWIVISGLHIESASTSSTDGAPINLQVKSDHWRVVNNELGPWPAASGAKAGGLVGNGTDVKVLGNEIHHIAGGTLNHGVYLDTAATNVEIGFNDIHHVTSGNLIQTFDNLGSGNITGITIHHNLIHDGGRYGLNMSDGTVSVRAYNNIIYNTAYPGIRINQNARAALSQVYEHNTLYNVCTSSSEKGAISNTWTATSGSVKFQYNIIAKGSSAGCPQGYANSSSDSAVSLSRNLYTGYSAASKDLNALVSQLTTSLLAATGLDFHLQSGSPAIDAAVGSSITDDYSSASRAGTPDVGAYEYGK